MNNYGIIQRFNYVVKKINFNIIKLEANHLVGFINSEEMGVCV